jgi:hypothetical protein
MATQSSQKSLIPLLAAVSLVVWTATADAGYVRGRFDPSFTGDGSGVYGDLGFQGEALFFVDDPCITAGSVPKFVTFPNGCGSVRLDALTVNLYEFPDPLPIDVVQTVSTAAALPIADIATKIYVEKNPATYLREVTGIRTGFIALEDAATDMYTGPLWLKFDFSFPSYSYSSYSYSDTWASTTFPLAITNAFLVACPPGNLECTPTTALISVPAQVTLQAVPEPTTLALLLGAGAAGWLARRRRFEPAR